MVGFKMILLPFEKKKYTFAPSKKRRGALLGSNSSRNSRQGFIPMKGLPSETAFLSLGNTLRCLKKTNDELVATLAFHSVVVA